LAGLGSQVVEKMDTRTWMQNGSIYLAMERRDNLNQIESPTPIPPWGKPDPGRRGPVRLILAAACLWVLTVCGGYYIAKVYIDRSVEAVQQTNAVQVQAIENRLNSMASDIDQIRLALNNADRSIASSGSTQQNLNQRITDLDKQLQMLAKSLQILKEAP